MFQNSESELKSTNEILQKFSDELEEKRKEVEKANTFIFITDVKLAENTALYPDEKRASEEKVEIFLTQIKEFIAKVRQLQAKILSDNNVWIDTQKNLETLKKDHDMISNWIEQLGDGRTIQNLMDEFEASIGHETLFLLGWWPQLSYDCLNEGQKLLVEIAHIKNQVKDVSVTEWWNSLQEPYIHLPTLSLHFNSFALLSNQQKECIKEASREIRQQKNLREYWNLLEQEKSNRSDYNTVINLLLSEYEKETQASPLGEKEIQEFRVT